MKNIAFIDHDSHKFPKLLMSRYMTSVKLVEGGNIQIVPMEWAWGVKKSSILSLMHMPHFGFSVEVNACVKQLLVWFHRGFLWIDGFISVYVELISAILGLPKVGVNPTLLFTGNQQDSSLVGHMKEKYNLSRDKRGFYISSINDTSVRFTTRVISSKILINMWPN